MIVVIEVDRSCEPGALNDDFEEETFDEDDGNGVGTHDVAEPPNLMPPRSTCLSLDTK